MSQIEDLRGNQVNGALELIGRAQQGVDAVTKPLGAAIAADPNDLPEWLRPWQAAQRRMCDRFSFIGYTGPNSAPGRAYLNACAPYLGANTPVYDSEDVPPTIGGQCPQAYNWNVSIRQLPIDVVVPFSGQSVGPHSWSRTPTGGPGSISLNLLNGAGQVVAGLTTGIPGTTFSVDSQSFSLVSGLPDNCGDNPGTPPGWKPVVTGPIPPPDFVYNPNDGGPGINIEVGSPVVNIDGTISLNIDVGGVTANVFGGYPSGTSGGQQEPDFESPGTPETPDAGENEKDSDTKVSCVIVNTTVINEGRGFQVFSATWRSYNPPLAHIRFKFDNGGRTDWIPIRHESQLVCFPCCGVQSDGYQIKWDFLCNGNVIPIPLKES